MPLLKSLWVWQVVTFDCVELCVKFQAGKPRTAIPRIFRKPIDGSAVRRYGRVVKKVTLDLIDRKHMSIVSSQVKLAAQELRLLEERYLDKANKAPGPKAIDFFISGLRRISDLK